MININNYILEKLHLSKDTKIQFDIIKFKEKIINILKGEGLTLSEYSLTTIVESKKVFINFRNEIDRFTYEDICGELHNQLNNDTVKYQIITDKNHLKICVSVKK